MTRGRTSVYAGTPRTQASPGIVDGCAMLRGRWTLKTVFLTAMLAALALPGVAHAGESAYVNNGTLYYANTPGEDDHVTVASGGTSYPGQLLVSETYSGGLVAGAGCSALAASQLACTGPVSLISVNTTSGADRVTINVAVPATVFGVTEDDVLTTGDAADWVYGGDGADTIDGRGGSDWLSGDAGNDVIEARDGASDVVACGFGVDTAYVDPGDSTSSCETIIGVTAPEDPVVTPDVPVTPVVDEDVDPRELDPVNGGVIKDDRKDDGEDDDELTDALDPDAVALLGPLRIGTTRIAVSAKGIAAFDLACAPTEASGCRGTMYLDPALAAPKGKGKGKGKAKGRSAKVRAVAARRGRFGKSPFVVAAGKRKKLSVKLSGDARKALGLRRSSGKARASRRGRAVRARVTVVQNGRRASHTVVTLRG